MYFCIFETTDFDLICLLYFFALSRESLSSALSSDNVSTVQTCPAVYAGVVSACSFCLCGIECVSTISSCSLSLCTWVSEGRLMLLPCWFWDFVQTSFQSTNSAWHAALPRVLVSGVRVTHPHHRRSAAGHSHRALLQRFRAGQCSGCHTLLLSAEHFLQKGEIFVLWLLQASVLEILSGVIFLNGHLVATDLTLTRVMVPNKLETCICDVRFANVIKQCLVQIRKGLWLSY